MKNKSVRLILSLAALGVLLGGYLGLKVSVSKQEESDEENLEEKKTNVFDVETDAIEALKFTIDDKEVTFDKKDGTWIKKMILPASIISAKMEMKKQYML